MTKLIFGQKTNLLKVSDLTNVIAGGGLESMAAGLISNAAHKFIGVSPETGRIIGAIAGNLIFNIGGKHNSLSGVGKILLDNLVSGKYQRKVFFNLFLHQNFKKHTFIP